MKIVSLKEDFAFREFFAHERVLKQFISDVTGIALEDIKTVRITTPFLRKRHRRQKLGILDVAVVMNDNTRIDIEMQVHAQKYWIKRNLFYLSQMYTGDLWVGERYDCLRKCITISLLDFDLFEGETYHSVYTLRDKDGKEFTDLFEIHIIEMGKTLRENDAVGDWIRLFNAEREEDLEMIEAKSIGMQEALEVVRSMGLIKNLRWRYEAHLKAVRDRWAEDEYVRDLGKAEGKAEGKADAILRILNKQGEIPEKLRERIMTEKDENTLNTWLMEAVKPDSLQGFAEIVNRK